MSIRNNIESLMYGQRSALLRRHAVRAGLAEQGRQQPALGNTAYASAAFYRECVALLETVGARVPQNPTARDLLRGLASRSRRDNVLSFLASALGMASGKTEESEKSRALICLLGGGETLVTLSLSPSHLKNP